jgi:hypothetical protein
MRSLFSGAAAFGMPGVVQAGEMGRLHRPEDRCGGVGPPAISYEATVLEPLKFAEKPRATNPSFS